MTISMEDPNLKKRIFCLTDGAVSNPDEVVELAKTDSIVVHTVGIGDGCDTNMLARTAKEGRGTYSQIGDGESDSVLNGKVITALQKALEPALEHCSISWGTQVKNLDTVFRNELVQEGTIITE